MNVRTRFELEEDTERARKMTNIRRKWIDRKEITHRSIGKRK